MTEKKPDELLSGNYDGIQEYDNDLPKWWMQLFVISIIWSVAYVIYIHFTGAPNDEQRLATEMTALNEVRHASEQANAPKGDISETLIKVATDASRVAKGKDVFASRCAPCHAQSGEGLVGPNLTDEYWLHGGTIKEIHHVIEAGVPEKGMLAWKGLLTPEDIENVTVFLWSIRNTNVKGREPQGDKVQ